MKKIIPEQIKNKERFAPCDYKEKTLDKAIAEALKKVDQMMIDFPDAKFPRASSTNNVYPAVENNGGWQSGFWSGILWLSYELTGDEKYKNAALAQIDSYYERIRGKIGILGHDVGFLYSLSCVAAYKLTGNEKAKEAALMAAEHLRSRYHEKGKFIQAWGQMTDKNAYRLIVDCLLNIPILYWATAETGDESYKNVAYTHFRTTVEVAIREDASHFHTFYFDPETGLPLRGVTKQGRDNNSTWSRGAGWIIYGMMLTKKYMQDDPDAVNICSGAVKYYLNRLPKDFIPFWDLEFTEADGEETDSSAAPIAICGMLELLKYLPDGEDKEIFENAIDLTMQSLYDNYSTKDTPEANGLLLHAVYSKPDKVGIDEMNIWGCYFYMEALKRLKDKNTWNLYW